MAHYRPEQHNILHYADEFFGHSNRKRPRLIYKIYLEEKIQKTKAGGEKHHRPFGGLFIKRLPRPPMAVH